MAATGSVRGDGVFGNQPFGWTEAAVAIGVIALFSGWALAWDGLGLLQGGPLPYGNRDHCDAWHYFGLSLFPEAGRFLAPGSRFIARPMYFGPVFALKSLLPSINVGVLSYLLFLNVTLSASYVGLRALFSRITAALACILLGLSPLLLSISSATYVTIASLAYSCCMLASLLWAARLRGERRLLSGELYGLAGFFFLCSANANLMAIKFNFLFCLFALGCVLSDPIDLRRGAAQVLEAALLFLLGALCGTAAVVLLSLALGLGAMTPYRQVIVAMAGMGENHYSGWAGETLAFGLIFLAGTLCAIAIRQARFETHRRARQIQLAAGIVVATCLFNLHASLVVGDQNLTYDWFYLLLLPSVTLAFCAAFDGAIAAMTRRARGALLAAAVAGIVLFNGLVAWQFAIKSWLFNNTQLALDIALAVFLFALVVGRLRGTAAVAAAVFGVALSLQVASGSTLRNHFFYPRAGEKAQAEMAEAALQYVVRHLDEEPVVWVASADDPQLALPIVRGLVRCPFEASFPDALPDPQANRQPPLAAGRTLVVLDGHARGAARIDDALRPHGYRLEVSADRVFPLDQRRGLEITIGKVRAL